LAFGYTRKKAIKHNNQSEKEIKLSALSNSYPAIEIIDPKREKIAVIAQRNRTACFFGRKLFIKRCDR